MVTVFRIRGPGPEVQFKGVGVGPSGGPAGGKLSPSTPLPALRERSLDVRMEVRLA